MIVSEGDSCRTASNDEGGVPTSPRINIRTSFFVHSKLESIFETDPPIVLIQPCGLETYIFERKEWYNESCDMFRLNLICKKVCASMFPSKDLSV